MLGKLVSLFGFLLRIALSGIIMRNASTRAAPQNMPAQPLKSVDTGTPANELLTQMLNAGKIEPQEREQSAQQPVALAAVDCGGQLHRGRHASDSSTVSSGESGSSSVA